MTTDMVLDRVGLDYAGPLLLKSGSVRKPTIAKAYVSVFVSLSTKAVHLELVTDLTTEAFIACLCRFVYLVEVNLRFYRVTMVQTM